LTYREDGDRVAVDYFGQPTYVFPRRDCALIPIPNSTAEMLAQYLGTLLRQELGSRGYTHLTSLEVEVEENYGQSATYREALAPD
jgi:6-pyruvoyltetrahydropterin/6-carboxytetrahydropterin synthase